MPKIKYTTKKSQTKSMPQNKGCMQHAGHPCTQDMQGFSILGQVLYYNVQRYIPPLQEGSFDRKF